jgi:hypothetical protein
MGTCKICVTLQCALFDVQGVMLDRFSATASTPVQSWDSGKVPIVIIAFCISSVFVFYMSETHFECLPSADVQINREQIQPNVKHANR